MDELEIKSNLLQNKISKLFVDTAVCFYKNAKKRNGTDFAHGQHDGIQFVGPNHGSVPTDQMIQIQSHGELLVNTDWGENILLYENSKDRKELSNHKWLYSVYNRCVKNTMSSLNMFDEDIHRFSTIYSPFEYCPISILEQLRDTYPSIIEELKILIPQKIIYIFGQQRKSQDDYHSKIKGVLSDGKQRLFKSCEQYIEEQKREKQTIWDNATREGRMEFADPYYASQHKYDRGDTSMYKDGFRIIELETNILMISSLCKLLHYPFREMGPFFNSQTPYGMGYGPSDQIYSNWQDNMAQLYIEALDCHFNMLRKLVPIRKKILSIETNDKLSFDTFGNNYNLHTLFKTKKNRPIPPKLPRPLNHSSRRSESHPRTNKSRGISLNNSPTQKKKTSNGVGFGKSFRRPQRMFEITSNKPIPGTYLNAYVKILNSSKNRKKLKE